MGRGSGEDETATRPSTEASGLAYWSSRRAVAYVSALAAGVATLIATNRGPGIGVDSTVYLSSGLNLATGDGLRVFDGGSLTIFPPGLPFVVALGHWLGLSAEWTVRLFNAAAFGGAVYLGFVLLRRHVRSNALIITSTVLLALSPSLLATSQMALTEPAFIIVCLGLVLVLEDLVATPRSVPLLIAAVALVWIGFAFRYAGLALVPAAGLALLVGRRAGLRERVTSAAVVVTLAALGPLAWMARNHRVDGTFMGFRNPSTDTVRSTATSFVETLGSWALPGISSAPLHQLVGSALVLIGAGVLVWWVARRRRDPLATDLVTHGARPSLAPILAFVVVDIAYLVVAQLTTAIDALNTRLLSPLYVPLVVLGTLTIDRLSIRVPARSRRLAWWTVGAVLALFLVGQTTVFVRDARRDARDGVFYTAQWWQSSELAQAARDVPADADLYSNDPWGLWAILRRNGIENAPFKGGYRSDATFAVPEWFLMSVRCRPSYFASFDAGYDFFYTAEELREHVDLVPVSTDTDGALYRIEPLASDTAPCAWR